MGVARLWFMAARPRTLTAAIAPVLVGTAAASADDQSFRWLAFAAALLGSILIQIGTNLANDYSDAKRGADTVDRLGPLRVTASGLVAPDRVLRATWIVFGLAVICGLYLATVAGPVILAVGAVSIAAGVLYTGGPRPYGYAGLGELFVFFFFGLVAVNGSYFVQAEGLGWLPFGLSVSIGLLATAVIVVNNYRDLQTDARVGKHTLAVRLGRARTRVLFVALILGGLIALPLTLWLAPGPTLGLLGLVAAPLALPPVRHVLGSTDGPTLNRALGEVGLLLGAFGLLTSLGLVL